MGAYCGAGARAQNWEHEQKQQKQYLGTVELKERGALCGSGAQVYKEWCQQLREGAEARSES